MRAKEMAKQIVKEFLDETNLFTGSQERHAVDHAKRNAIICVNALIKEHTHKHPIPWNGERKRYWELVKDEIESL